jgi:hypothetical protein
MTGVTGHGVLDVEVSFVDIQDHLDHAPGGEFCWFVVLIELIGVAIAASHAKRSGDESHGWIQLSGGKIFEYLNVLEALPGSLWNDDA